MGSVGKNSLILFVGLQSTDAHSGLSGEHEVLTTVGKSSTQ